MTFLAIPNEIYANNGTMWVAAVNENFAHAATVLEVGDRQIPLNTGWNNFGTADGKNRISYQRVSLDNLTQATRHSFGLRVGGQLVTDGSFTTIPWHLPRIGERPFTVLLGSCFYGRGDKTGAVGQTYMRMAVDARPDVKFLCGDQVYLDNPPQDFLNPLNGKDWLESRSFRTYFDNWTQTTAVGGFGQMLKHNANFFSSDDHEYWNNAPDVGLNVPFFTLSQKNRDAWWTMAHNLYKVFQTSPGQPVRFVIEPLSFCIAETRFNRGSGHGGGGAFMLAADLDAIGNWTANLDGPGVLVVGQPVFSSTGSIKDYGLPDFKQQYSTLLAHLRNSRHSIVILTGDVHFGRVAVSDLRPELGTKLYEVISSPMQQVPGAPGAYSPAPPVFGSVSSEPDFSQGRNHFLTLEFTSPSAQRASMLIRFWPIIQNGMLPQSQIVGNGPVELL